MRGLTFDGALRYRDDLPVPEPAPGEVRVKVTVAGVCATDLAITAGYMGFHGILGHEFVGRVDTGAGGIATGQRVVGEINAACGHCPTCRAGRPRHCPQRTVLGILGRGGAFAEYLTLPADNLLAVPESVSDQMAVFVEPLAAAFRIPEQLSLQGNERVYVLGDGRLGLLCAQVLHLSGCRVTLFGRHPQKCAVAAGWGIATTAADLAAGAERADVVVDCTGRPEGLQLSASLTRPCGTVVLKTTSAHPPEWNPAPLVVDEITVVGSRCGPFAPALAALAGGRIDVAPLVAASYPLEEGTAAFAAARAPGALKVLLIP